MKQSIFKTLIQLGTSPEDNALENRQIRTVNGTILILIGIVLLFIVTNALTGLYTLLVFNLAFILLALLPSLYWQSKRHFILAKYFLVIGVLVYLIYAHYWVFKAGRNNGSEWIIIMYFLLVILLFEGKKAWPLTGIGLLGIPVLLYYKFLFVPHEGMSFTLSLINFYIVIFSIYGLATFFKQELLNTQQQLSNLVADLHGQNDELLEKNRIIENSERILSGAIDHVPLFIAMLDKEGNYLIANKMYEDTFDIPRSQIIGKHYTQILPKEILSIHTPLLMRGLAGETVEFEHETVFPKGQKIYSYGKYAPILSLDGQSVEYLTVFVTDVSRLKRAEQKLNELNHTKDKLFSIIAHDLRAPLNSLFSLVDTLNNQIISQDEFKALIKNLDTSVGYNRQLLENLLQWSKAQMNQIVVKKVAVDINALAFRNKELFEETAHQKNIRIVTHLEALEKGFADPNMIDLVVRNLLSNALKFTPKGGSITLESFDTFNEVGLSIIDTGLGMSDELLAKINNNQMVTEWGTDKEKGSGLGITLCKEFLSQNEGHLTIASQLGKGSTFTFIIPKQFV